MKSLRPSGLIRQLRSPAVIVAEIAAIAGAGALGATWPALRVFQSAWFVALIGLMAVSLAIVVSAQGRRLWCAGATTQRVGSAVLHLGLLLVIVAGALRALFATEAVVELLEGETLPPTAAAWREQAPRRFAQPFHLDQPVTLEAVHGSRYPDGSLRQFTARLSAGDLAVNRDLTVPGGRIFLTAEFGPAVLLEWTPARREAVLLHPVTRDATAAGPHGLGAHLRAQGDRPDRVEVRVMRDNGLLFAGDLRPGETLRLASGETLTVHRLPLWVRLRGSRDPALGLAYSGFALLLTGSVLLFIGLPAGGPRSVVAVALPWARPAAALLPLVLVCAACGRSARDEARQLVERYNRVVAEAYRRGDVKLLEPVVGPEEGKKLTGLIGVRLDLGLTLDAQLLALDVTRVEQGHNELQVQTRERWRYRDRRIGTGEQVGEASTDSYEMRYVFKNTNRTWLVDEIQFAAPPQVGRTTTTWATTHGVEIKR